MKLTPDQMPVHDPVYVDTDQLRGHAVQVGDLAARADVAAEAANHVSELDDGYGTYGQIFAESLIRDVNDPGKRAIADAAKALHGIRRKLEANADSFSGTDEHNRRELEREGEGIGPSGPPGPNGAGIESRPPREQ